MPNEIRTVALSNLKLNRILDHLPMCGKIKILNHCFAYLDIDDCFIHQVFPLLTDHHIKKPNYFNEVKNFIGAHISLIYPEEKITNINHETNDLISFTIEGLFKAYMPEKIYYILKVNSAELLKFRSTYGLSDKLLFKGYLIDLHITVAVDTVG